MSPRTRPALLVCSVAFSACVIAASAWFMGGVTTDPPPSSGSARSASVSSSPQAAAAPKEKAPKPPKDASGETPVVEEPPAPPVVEEPPAPPVVEEPAVVPEPEEPPAPAAAPDEVTALACTAGDMQDIITFTPPSDGGPVSGYALYLGAADTTPTLIATTGAEGRSFIVPITETALRSYRVSSTGTGGEGPLSDPVTNDLVSITADVPPEGATIRASNGEMSLALPPGSYATTTTVTVTEVDGSPRGGLISLAGVYELSPSGPLGAPATLSVAYTTSIEHFQVKLAVLASAKLLTYDAASGTWTDGATGITSDATFISGTLSHFSYWTAATVQPHGTSSTLYCADGGICHNLATYPDSATRIAARSSEVCYNCHGNVAASGAEIVSPNVEAEFGLPGSHHPVIPGAFTGASGSGIYCVICHDPHADPAASPGLLKARDAATGTYVQGGGTTAPGNAFCWTCHGTLTNKLVNYYQPGYFLRTGGDKKTGFNGAHTAARTYGTRWDAAEELSQGSRLATQVLPGGTVENTFEQVILSKDPVAVASPPFQNGVANADKVYDGDLASTGGAVWYAGLNLGASAATSWVGTGTVTIDLGTPTEVRKFEVVGLTATGRSAHVVEVQTSDTGGVGTFVPLVTQGQLGTALPFTTTLTAPARTRYVRFVFSRQFVAAGDRLDITELNIYGFTPGTFTVRPQVARLATFMGGVVKWGATGPASSQVTVDARLSTNNGVGWSAWQPVSNGGPLLSAMVPSALGYALMEVRVTLPGTPGATAALDWIEVSTTRGDIAGTTPQWSGESPSNECQRCHVSHGSANPGLVSVDATAACINCHGAALGSYPGAGEFGASAHGSEDCASCHTSHGNASGSGPTYAYLLNATPRDACLNCHVAVRTAFEAKQGAGAERAKHDVYPLQQVISGSRLGCSNCHSTHRFGNGLVNPDDPSQAYSATQYDPASIPTEEVVIYASMDTILDSANPDLNYGQSTQGTITPTSRALLYFDLSSIPVGATIQDAALVLWPSNPADVSSVDHYVVYPITSSWREGSGMGTLNDGTVNGATWLERESGLPWTTAGGSLGPIGPYGVHTLVPRNITDMIRALRTGPNYGIAVAAEAADPSTSLPIYMDEYAGASSETYRPRLRVVYQTGPGTEVVLSDQAFCLKCHDNDMPFNLKGLEAITRINTAYEMYTPHGAARGTGPGYGSGSGTLKSPYSWGMDALPCGTCHDPHGSRLPFHLRESVNGRDMTPVLSSGWTSASAATVPAYFCGACHVLPGSHPGDLNTPSVLCSGLCHSAGH